MEYRAGENVLGHRRLVRGAAATVWSMVAAVAMQVSGAGADTLKGPINHPTQESIDRVPFAAEMPKKEGQIPDTEVVGTGVAAPVQVLPAPSVLGNGYDPGGRRDPFAPVIQELPSERVDENLPPLQRVSLAELNLVAIVWGSFGYTAMVQTPEGYGYTIRRGTKIGQNNGVVTAITERGIIVQERFTDVYGKKQERELVKLLHPKEGSE